MPLIVNQAESHHVPKVMVWYNVLKRGCRFIIYASFKQHYLS